MRFLKLACTASLLAVSACSSSGSAATEAGASTAVSTYASPSSTLTTEETPAVTPTETAATSQPRATKTTESAVDVWMRHVKGGYGPEDAEWACETLRENPTEAAWNMVGDERLIWAGKLLCKEFAKESARAERGFYANEVLVVGETVRPGRYVSRPKMESCYWERMDDHGGTLANDFVTNSLKGVIVRIRASDGGFKADGCGAWLPVS